MASFSEIPVKAMLWLFLSISSCGFAAIAADAHPMSTRSDFLVAKHTLTFYIHFNGLQSQNKATILLLFILHQSCL